MKVITDLERIGDEADRMAKMALDVADSEKPEHQYADFRAIHANVDEKMPAHPRCLRAS